MSGGLGAGITLATVTGLSYRYGRDAPLALREISLRIAAGEIVMVTGPSASGKTTLLSLIGTLRRTPAGTIRLFGTDVGAASDDEIVGIRRRVRFVFQKHYLLRSLTVLQNVIAGTLAAPTAVSASRKTWSIESLQLLGLGEQIGRWPDQLSTGQQQRVAVARALAGKPDLLLADEPTASLDRESARLVADGILAFAGQGRGGVIIATHDERIVDIATRHVRMKEGAIVA